MISDATIEKNQAEILDYLRKVDREGMENVIRFLEEDGFFNLPSSDRNHHNWKGGLAQHSLEVLKNALFSYPKLPKESIIIASLLHDICKIDQFKIDDNGKIVRTHSSLKGHGSKSLHILHELGLKMTPEEERAIRYHMKSMKPRPEDSPGLLAARKDSLWWAIRKSDGISAKQNGH